MAGQIPKTFIDDLTAKADLVDVIGRRIPLKKAGRSYKACCPFHNEKTPSFNVNQQKGFYHCFGCGASGDALRFIMDYEHLDFVSAVEVLAAEMGLSVPRERASKEVIQARKQQQKKQLEGLWLLAQAAQWFVANLKNHPQKTQAIAYLQQRGLTGEIAHRFALGLAPNDAQALQRAFPDVTTEQWLKVGLVVEREGLTEIRDKYRNRIVFPIRNIKGQVIAFGGRLMGSSDFAPKYLNSPETEFFHKSATLYGLYEMLQVQRGQPSRVLVVEGYMDVVALAQFGVTNVVATLGTATTAEHLQVLFRHTKEVIFAFDGDEAGKKAAWKALTIALALLRSDWTVRFFFLPQGDDPDSFIRQQGAERFNQALDSALSAGEWLVRGLAELSQLSWHAEDDIRRLLVQAQPLVQANPNDLIRYALVQALAVASRLQEWQVEKILSIHTGLAVRWRDNRHAVVPVAQLTAGRLESRMQLLLREFPQLAQQGWPKEELSWLMIYGSQQLKQLLTEMNGQALSKHNHEKILTLSEAEAQQEWQDGWQKLLYQTALPAKIDLLSQLSLVQQNENLHQLYQKLEQIIRQYKTCQSGN